MLTKRLIPFVLASGLAVSAFAADIEVRIRPPRVRVEHRGRAPGPGMVWVQGYQRWDGNGYVWTPGRWEAPPRAHARWYPHRWVRRHNNWVFVEGGWR